MKNLTIGRKVLFLVVGIVLSICLILGFINYREASSALIDSMELTLVELAKTASTSIRLKLDIHFTQLETVADEDIMKSWVLDDQVKEMRRLVEISDFTSLAVAGMDGIAHDTAGREVNIQDREYFREALGGKTVISDAVVSRADGNVIFIIATPLKDASNRISGILLGTLEGAFLTDVIDALSYGEKGYAYAVDKRGAMIAHKNRDLVINQVSYIEEAKKDKKFAEIAALLTKMTSGETGTGGYFYEGEVRYMGYSPVEGTTWSIAMGSYESEALAPVHDMLIIVIISSLALGVIFILISIFLSRSIGNQIMKVNNQIQDLADAVLQGRLNERADVDRIAVDFKGSADSINHLIDAFVKPITMTLKYLDLISKGDMPPQITETYHGDFNKIKVGLNQCIDAVTSMVNDVNTLVEAASREEFDTRADATKHQGDYNAIVAGINKTFDLVANKLFLYEMTLDSVPYPVSVTDLNMNWLFINRAAENITNLKRKDVMGQHCSKWNADICDTQKCGVALLKAGENTSYFKQPGVDMDFQVDTQWLVNQSGQQIGHIEVIQDITSTKRVADYMDAEVNIVIERLTSLAKGEMSFSTDVTPPDQYTTETAQKFEAINGSLQKVKDALSGLTDDAKMLVEEVLMGRLSTRAEVDRHNGEYARVIKGVNDLLEAVVNPINEVMDVMGRLARKDMTARVQGNYKGDLNIFKQNVNNAGDNLEDALSQVERAVQQITAAAGEIANGSQSLAAGSSEQASSLEEIASSLEEMNSLTLNNADNSKQGMELSEQSLVHVRTGNSAMDRMNHAMDAISKSARETSNIIKTINDIAFQTNLLALNAAVEAAHAGEAGKGFAVVAEEVKNLALRSAEAAQNTDDLIEASLKNSEDGAKIVEEVSASFENIQSSFSKVNNIVKEISISSEEQSEGIRQVNVAVGELNKVTQGNAANAEESASAAEELNSQAAELKTMVQEFELSNSSGPMTRRSNDFRQVAPPKKKASLPAPPKAKGAPGNKYGNKDMEIILPMDDDYDGEGDF